MKCKEAVGGFAIDSISTRKVFKPVYYNENSNEVVKRAMIDLDGTIHKYSKGYGDGTIYDDAFEGAKEVIDWLRDSGYEIVIFTTRASEKNAMELGGDVEEQVENIANWLDEKGIYFDYITAEKIAADFYIDDKAIPIVNGNWEAVLKAIKKKVQYSDELEQK